MRSIAYAHKNSTVNAKKRGQTAKSIGYFVSASHHIPRNAVIDVLGPVGGVGFGLAC